MPKNKKGFIPHQPQQRPELHLFPETKPTFVFERGIPKITKKIGGGFTLMELLIVIAIIAILAAGLIAGLNPARQFKAARNSTRWQHMNAIASAIYSYAVEHEGNFPRTENDEFYCIGEASENGEKAVKIDDNWCKSTDEVTLIVPDYLRSVPKDPTAGEYYQIEFVDDSKTAIKITSTAKEANEEGKEVYLIQ